MEFAIVCIGMIVVLGVIAAIANRFDKGKATIEKPHDCASCSAVADGSCKIGCLIEEKKREKGNNN